MNVVTISMEGFPPRHDFFDLWDKTKDRLKGTCLRIIPKKKYSSDLKTFLQTLIDPGDLIMMARDLRFSSSVISYLLNFNVEIMKVK